MTLLPSALWQPAHIPEAISSTVAGGAGAEAGASVLLSESAEGVSAAIGADIANAISNSTVLIICIFHIPFSRGIKKLIGILDNSWRILARHKNVNNKIS
jgi:hypothetical protein